MYIPESLYRQHYEGELLTRIDSEGKQERLFAKSRNLYNRPDFKGTAMVIGNGKSRKNNTLDLFLRTNRNRILPSYKMTYGCNGAVWDLECDYYVITNRLFFSDIADASLAPQFVVPYDIWLNYRHSQLIPLVTGNNAGVLALYLACFDGNDKIFMFGFDMQDGTCNNNCYAGKPGYDPEDTAVDSATWVKEIMLLMTSYPKVQFYRVGGGPTPVAWQNKHNFQDVTYREAVFLGDF
jgi:hypothetical protein